MSQLWPFLVLGLASGGAYALTAVGIVTVYRGTGVINLAHGAMGMVGTYVFFQLFKQEKLPASIAVPAGIVAGAALGAIVYAVVMRPLRNSIELARLVATLGVLMVLQGLATVIYSERVRIVKSFVPDGALHLWGASMSYGTIVVLGVTILLAIGLATLFRRTRLGLSAAAVQENPDAASVLGVSPHASGLLMWTIGGALASAAGIVLVPTTGLSPSGLTLLIFPALAAALFGKFTKYPSTIIAGLAIGILESLFVAYQWDSAFIKIIPFGVIIVALMVGGSTLPGRGHAEQRLPRIGAGLLRPPVILVAAVLAVVAVLFLPVGWAVALTTMAIVSLIALSIVVATGYAGQLSLAPFAIAGATSLFVAHLSRLFHIDIALALVLGIIAATLLGWLVGLPAIRVRGVDLAVATLGFALVIETALLINPKTNGGLNGLPITDPRIFGIPLVAARSPRGYAVFACVVFALAALGIACLRRSRAGRRMAGVRANERGAAALGISVPGAKLAGFAIAGGVAGIAGVLLAFRMQVATFDNFDVFKSINALGWTTVGGLGMIPGAVFAGGAAAGGPFSYILRNVDEIDAWLPVLSGIFVVIVMITHPDGEIDRMKKQFGDLFAKLRGRGAAPAVAAEPPVEPDRTAAEPVSAEVNRASGTDRILPGAERRAGQVLLTVRDVTVKYGPVKAVDAVTLDVVGGAVIGVIGPNGAGKTSLIDSITGFATASGSVSLGGRELIGLSATKRSRAGLTRTFQNLELFVDLTVRENLLAAADRRDLLGYASGLIRSGPHELSGVAATAVALLGLEELLDRQVMDLPQGTQRIVAIARALASEPEVICLDEPTAGLSGTERAEVITAIRALVETAKIGVLLVEHNLDVVAGLCDTVVAIDFGRVIAQGAPEEVLGRPEVRQAYLGSHELPEQQAIAPKKETVS
ncbi:ABC transporter permease subunit [Amycolatopsis thermophila]|uniref:Sulfate-transporting ATPase n=1 Tax=Amycolatopsis thermophila TaxID=206084 RepID=A0ABU0F526_9PSEU|nr:ATP-binding cassette domain-containing protein [Amycolatopsis thermophila]MDQ0382685.1 sulfate-transporting ATPase [Amycolatopsis thermophila]